MGKRKNNPSKIIKPPHESVEQILDNLSDLYVRHAKILGEEIVAHWTLAGLLRDGVVCRDGFAPMHYVCQMSDPHLVKCLVSTILELAKIHCPDKDLVNMKVDGKTPLDILYESHGKHKIFGSIVNIFIQNGADIPYYLKGPDSVSCVDKGLWDMACEFVERMCMGLAPEDDSSQ